MVLTERMQALGDHARSSNQRLIAERRQERDQDSRDDESGGQEILDQAIRDQKNRAPEIFSTDNGAASTRGETIMLEAAVSMPSPPDASPADDVIIIENIETFLAVDELAPERAVPENGGGSAPEPAIAPGPGAPTQFTALGSDDDLAAKRAIIHEWQNWSALNSDELGDPNVAAYFFRHLEARKPKLLDFASEDKMKAVRDWLQNERCIAA